MRQSFAQARELLARYQRKLGRPPKDRQLIRSLVAKIIKYSDLAGDPREGYFKLLAMSALLGCEPLYNSYKPKPRKRP